MGQFGITTEGRGESTASSFSAGSAYILSNQVFEFLDSDAKRNTQRVLNGALQISRLGCKEEHPKGIKPSSAHMPTIWCVGTNPCCDWRGQGEDIRSCGQIGGTFAGRGQPWIWWFYQSNQGQCERLLHLEFQMPCCGC